MSKRLTMRINGITPRCNMVSTDFCLMHKTCYDCGHYKNMVASLADYEDAEERKAKHPDSYDGNWISTKDRLPTVWQYVDDTDHCGEPLDFIVFIEGAELPTTLWFNGKDFIDESGMIYSVTDWMEMPLPPRKRRSDEKEAEDPQPLPRPILSQMVGQPVWVTHHDGSGGRWGIVNRYEAGLCADVADGVSYWFDCPEPAIAYREKKEI